MANKRRTQIFGFLSAIAFLFSIIQMINVYAHDHDDDEDDDHKTEISQTRSNPQESWKNLSPATNAKWKTECASCHMLYPPGLLPERSWKKMMTGLDQHFGENASLDKTVRNEITEFLSTHSADRMPNKRGNKIARSIPPNEAPLRISETLYFRKKHDEVRPQTWKLKKVGSPANCIACHPSGETGNYSEHQIKIPRQ